MKYSILRFKKNRADTQLYSVEDTKTFLGWTNREKNIGGKSWPCHK